MREQIGEALAEIREIHMTQAAIKTALLDGMVSIASRLGSEQLPPAGSPTGGQMSGGRSTNNGFEPKKRIGQLAESFKASQRRRAEIALNKQHKLDERIMNMRSDAASYETIMRRLGVSRRRVQDAVKRHRERQEAGL